MEEPQQLPSAHKMKRPTQGRNESAYGNDDYNGLNLFQRDKTVLRVICSNTHGWEHVSVSTARRCPTWDEMCYIKHKYWPNDALVVQFHPPAAQYVNNHEFCLHLWRFIPYHTPGVEMPLPPQELV